jgi:Outer membrane protein beta-barrel domain
MRPLRTLAYAIVAASCLTAAALAQAQSFYVAGGAGRAHWSDLDCTGNCDRDTTGLRIAAGAWFNRVLAAEVFAMDMGSVRLADSLFEGKLRGRAIGALGLLGWRGERVDIAGKFGVAQVQARFEASPTSTFSSETKRSREPVFGMMLAVRATPQLSVRFDVDNMSVAMLGAFILREGGADVTTFSLGAHYAF